MIRVENLYHQIKGKTILDNISLEVEKGKLTSIIGPNGAGKTTLIHLMAGGAPYQRGNIYLKDELLSKYSIPELSRTRALLAQQNSLSFPIAVYDIIELGRQPFSRLESPEKSKEAIERSVALWGIEDFIHRDYLSLSGGEKQRVQFARVWTQLYGEDLKEKVLFLDEPLTYLDISHQLDFMDEIQKLTQQGVTVVAIFHQLELALKYSDQIVLMDQGKKVYSGSTKDLPPHFFEDVFRVSAHWYREGLDNHIGFKKLSKQPS
ncbi:MAG: ATP-binding cassette domain-containing protein [Crocinitomicaceae bacterium]|nr:ATP-binding cassette domain-containing protein [Crocinitomicaceae bacterium]